jgi:methionine-rich copper-binding protein CopC
VGRPSLTGGPPYITWVRMLNRAKGSNASVASLEAEPPMWRRRVLSQVVLILGLLVCRPAPAEAHARVVRSTPADRAEVAQTPVSIELWFDELLEDGFNSILVFAQPATADSPRKKVAEGQPVLDLKDRTHLSFRLKPLPPGAYEVEWRVLSKDGHSAPGRFRFRVIELHTREK